MAEKKNTKPIPETLKTEPEAEQAEIKTPEAPTEEPDTGEVNAPTGTAPETATAAETSEAAAGDAVETGADDEELVKSNFRKIRVKDFRGSYGNAKFDDNGVCEAIDKATYEQLTKQFPGAEVEFLD